MIIKNPKYKPLYTSDKRYFIITGGRGSAKSFESSTFLTLLSYEQNHRILFTRYTMMSAGLSIIPEFKEKIDLLEVDHQFKVNKTEITNNQTQSDIIFRGIKTSSGNQTAALKSITGVSTWVLDEAEELEDESIFDKIDLSIRKKDVNNRVILVMNPATKEHWIWQRWFDGHLKYIDIEGEKIPISTHPDICHIHTTYLDNVENLSDSYLKQIAHIKQNNPDKYKHVILGGWREKAEGVIFENWIEGEFDESLPYIWGMDFGYVTDPTTLVKVAIDGNKLYVKEYLYKNGLSTKQIADSIIPHVNKNDLIIGDSAEPRLLDELYDLGFNIQKCAKGKDSIRNGIANMQEMTMIVDADSPNLKKELNNYAWHDKKSNTPIDAYNHCFPWNTQILTSKGVKNIVDINEGDYVANSFGYNKVLKRWSNGVRNTTEYTMQFDMFSLSLCSTIDHKIKTTKGWIKIDELQPNDLIYLRKNLMGEHSIYMKEKDTTQKDVKECIVSYGSIIKGISQKTITYIMLMVIHSIMTLKISVLYITLYIYGLREKRGLKKIQILRKIFMLKGLKLLRYGTNQKKVESGTKNIGLTLLEDYPLLTKFVQFAQKNTKPNALLGQNTAITTARLKHLGKGKEKRKYVYDLYVEDNHEYIANGVVVHNCIDATRYAFTDLTDGNEFFVI